MLLSVLDLATWVSMGFYSVVGVVPKKFSRHVLQCTVSDCSLPVQSARCIYFNVYRLCVPALERKVGSVLCWQSGVVFDRDTFAIL